MIKHFYRFFFLFIFAALIALPAQATRIYFNYSLFGFSITTEQLETFAETGKIEGSLGRILGRFDSNQQAQIQAVLQARYQVDPLVIDRFGYTTPGERLFRELGELIQSEARQNGGRALRSAAVLAADDQQGISIISFLQHLPTDMRIDLQRVLRFGQRVSGILQETRQITADLNQQTQADITGFQSADIHLDSHLDLRQPGRFSKQEYLFELRDIERNRKIATAVYLPDSTTPAPVIVMSNGLGAGRDRFDEIAAHLVSHGFAVAIPDHPGSDRQRLREFYAGLQRENFDATEYLDRPKDVSFLLDQLEQLNPTQFGNRLNLQQVGIFGYSFGGSTALALGGAELDFDYLQQDCDNETGLVNISLLYQCRALELPRETISLTDERIKAAYIFVPFGKSLFGKAGMAKVNIPVFWEATDLDILTPLAVEQIPAFIALQNADSHRPRQNQNSDIYLAVSQGLPHARVTYDAISRLTNADASWETLKQIGHNYQNALSLAFFQVYVVGDASYRPYLTAAYARAITEPPYSLSLVQSIGEVVRRQTTFNAHQ